MTVEFIGINLKCRVWGKSDWKKAFLALYGAQYVNNKTR